MNEAARRWLDEEGYADGSIEDLRSIGDDERMEAVVALAAAGDDATEERHAQRFRGCGTSTQAGGKSRCFAEARDGRAAWPGESRICTAQRRRRRPPRKKPRKPRKKRQGSARRHRQAAGTKLQGSGAKEIDLDADTTGKKLGDAEVAVLAKVLPRERAEGTETARERDQGKRRREALANALPQCGLKEDRILYSSRFGDAGVAGTGKCAAAVWTNCIFYNNQIGDSGAQALAMRCRSVDWRSCILITTRIGDSGAQALANALPHCGLMTLNLDSNRIGDSVKSELKKMDKRGSNPVRNREG